MFFGFRSKKAQWQIGSADIWSSQVKVKHRTLSVYVANKASASIATRFARKARSTDFKRTFPPRSLYFLANAGRGTTERRARRNRTQGETRSNAGWRSLKSIGTVAERSEIEESDMEQAANRLWFSGRGVRELHGEQRGCEADDVVKMPSFSLNIQTSGFNFHAPFSCFIPQRVKSIFTRFRSCPFFSSVSSRQFRR